MNRTEIEIAAAERILVLDGGLGSMLQRLKLTDKEYRGERFAQWEHNLMGCSDLLVLTRPEAIEQVHEAYLRSGADIISTNTFNANGVSMQDYGLCDYIYEINLKAARLARALADSYTAKDPTKPRFVAGSVGPTNKMSSLVVDMFDMGARAVSFEELVEAYTPQIEALIEGGVDALLIETALDGLNVKAALYAATQLFDKGTRRVALMASGTLTDGSGRMLNGESVEGFYASLCGYPMLSVGFNCGCGADQLKPYVERLAAIARCGVSAHPNAGLPNAEGHYDHSAQMMAMIIESYLSEGLLNIVGGCCGTTPEHITAIVEVAKKYAPRTLKCANQVLLLGGLEPQPIERNTPTQLLGVGTSMSYSERFAERIHSGDLEGAWSLVSSEIDRGAMLSCVGVSLEGGIEANSLRRLMNLTMADPQISRRAVVVDTSDRELAEVALQTTVGRTVVRSLVLADDLGRATIELQLLRSYGSVAWVRFATSINAPQGVKIHLSQAEALLERAKELGIPSHEVIFDLELSAAGVASSADSFEFMTQLRAQYPLVRFGADLCRLAEGMSEVVRGALQEGFLCRAQAQGVDFALLDLSLRSAEVDESLSALVEAVLDEPTPHLVESLLGWSAK